MRRCDNLILHCIDYRIQDVLGEWIRAQNLQGNIDVVAIAGACKKADPALENIAVGLDMHGVRRVFLTQHDDCAAYGGREAFASPDAERTLLTADMTELKNRIRRNYPQIRVTMLHIRKLEDSWKIVEV